MSADVSADGAGTCGRYMEYGEYIRTYRADEKKKVYPKDENVVHSDWRNDCLYCSYDWDYCVSNHVLIGSIGGNCDGKTNMWNY